MPIYEYRCNKCDREVEVLCSLKESEETQFYCKECGWNVEKQISLSSFVMTGYRAENDYSISEDIGNRRN